MPDWNSLQQTLTRNLVDGNKEQSVAVAETTLAQGVDPVLFFEECLAPSLERIGNMFDELEIFLPELLSAAEIAQAINDEAITPAVQASSMGETRTSGKVILATVKADLHDIGKNMVALMLRVNGFEVVDLGIDVDSSQAPPL